ncbi:hypothetical protein OAP17_04060 [Porticoccaceae bacterium]|nr:hypothetical protein [Porticoccaceae bacterium]
MMQIVRFLCAAGLIATMLVSSVLSSQEGLEERSQTTAGKAEDAIEQEVSQTKPDQASKNQQSATDSDKKPAGDFKPSEEISEDFPVPLPSDI